MARKLSTKDRVKLVLVKSRKDMTYGELADKVGSGAMAVGQILKSLANDPKYKPLTRKVKAKAA